MNAVTELPPREAIVRDAHWRLAHAFGCALPGWLVLVPMRHVVSLDELDEAEVASLGPLLRRTTAALRVVTGCVKTYVALFAEAEGFEHVHFHVVPRMPDFAPGQRGPEAFGAFLGDRDDALSDEQMDAVASDVRRALTEPA